jgi:hypothetical protein
VIGKKTEPVKNVTGEEMRRKCLTGHVFYVLYRPRSLPATGHAFVSADDAAHL